jgi:hypothetical protein
MGPSIWTPLLAFIEDFSVLLNTDRCIRSMTWQWKSNFKDIKFTFFATGVEYGHTSAAEDLNPRHVVETLVDDWSFSRGQPLNKALTWPPAQLRGISLRDIMLLEMRRSKMG